MSDDNSAWRSKPASPYAGVYGKELSAPENASYIDDGLLTTAERVTAARRYWIEGRVEEFERVNRRKWVDTATGTVYRKVPGSPFLGSGGPAEAVVDVFLISGGKFILLERDDREAGKSIYHGPIRGGELVNGEVVWKE